MPTNAIQEHTTPNWRILASRRRARSQKQQAETERQKLLQAHYTGAIPQDARYQRERGRDRQGHDRDQRLLHRDEHATLTPPVPAQCRGRRRGLSSPALQLTCLSHIFEKLVRVRDAVGRQFGVEPGAFKGQAGLTFHSSQAGGPEVLSRKVVVPDPTR